MTGLTEQIEEMGIVPVIKLEDAGKAAGLAKALCEGGLPCAEVTFRTAAARDGIQIMSETCPDMLVGAGTVLNCEQVDQAVEAGARFIVSPGLNPEVVKYCQEKGVPVFPGCATPTEVEQAIRLGLKVVKFFPAEASGGLKAVQAMGAPYGQMRFMPTGGINAQNICNYLAWDRILACGGTWMVPSGALEQRDFAVVSIADTGIGINAADLPKIKNKFYKANSTRRGSGIGLAVADEIVNMHGGSLELRSTEGIGTTAIISLPVA